MLKPHGIMIQFVSLFQFLPIQAVLRRGLANIVKHKWLVT